MGLIRRLLIHWLAALFVIVHLGDAFCQPRNNPKTQQFLQSHIVELDNVERVFCLSDLHTDHTDNMKWVQDRMNTNDWQQTDLMVVAGDISHDLDRLEDTLRILREKSQVFFLPGNHEAWLHRNDSFDSLEKLKRVKKLCRKLNIHVDALYLRGRHPLWIVPLISWYDGSLSFDEKLCKGFKHWPWVDFIRCRWPFPSMKTPNDRIPDGLVEHLHQEENEPVLESVWRCEERFRSNRGDDNNKTTLMTVSHFLPNMQCLPDWVDLDADNFDGGEWLTHGAGATSAKFAKVAGSIRLDEQIRFHNNQAPQFEKQIHVFGHSHRPKDFVFNDIRYIHNPLGKPRERQLYMVSPNVDFQLVWEKDDGEVKGPRIVRYWEEFGGGRDALHRRLENVRPGRYGGYKKPQI